MRNRDEESRDEGRHYRPAGPAPHGADAAGSPAFAAGEHGHQARHDRYTAVGTAPVPPTSRAGGEGQEEHRQPMPAPRSMPTAGLTRPPRTPRAAGVSPAPAPPLQPRAEPTAINGHAPDDATGSGHGIRPVPGWPIQGTGGTSAS